MTPNTPHVDEAGQAPSTRLPYQAPELIDQGDVTEQTKSTGTGNGTDGAYS